MSAIKTRRRVTQTEKALAKTLKHIRVKSGASQRHVADVIGISKSHMSRLEAAQSKPTWFLLDCWARALDPAFFVASYGKRLSQPVISVPQPVDRIGPAQDS